MSDVTQVGDVTTWWDVQGDGEPLVLLHPGGADSRVWEANLPGLAERFRVFRFDRRGHGRTPDVHGPITFEQLAEDSIAFLETVVGAPSHLFGHSDGAPIALLIAHMRPDLVRRLVFASGPFHKDGWIPEANDLHALPPDVFEFLSSYHAEVAPEGERFAVLWDKLHEAHQAGPTLTVDDLARIATPTLMMFGDDDEVQHEHLHAMHAALPDAQLAIVPGTSHGVPADKPALVNRLVIDFLTEER